MINFSDLSPISEPVTLGDKQYTLREANGEAARQFNNARLERIKLGSDGKPQGVKGMADIESLLVSLCLFDSNDKPVPESTVKSWPYRIQKVLYARAKEISRLDETESKEAIISQIEALQAQLKALEEASPNAGVPTTDGSD